MGSDFSNAAATFFHEDHNAIQSMSKSLYRISEAVLEWNVLLQKRKIAFFQYF